MSGARRVIPMLSCADLAASLVFYRDLLGGTETFRYPEQGEPAFLSLALGATEVGLGGIAAEPLHGLAQRPASGHRIELCVYVDDVDATYCAAVTNGADALAQPADQPWGERTAFVADPDGNVVMLAC